MVDEKIVRCIHRHTIDEHPSCFKKGLILQAKDEKMAKRIRKEAKPIGPYKRIIVRKNPWYTVPGTKVGYWDIEADNLKANFGTLLSWALKPKGSNKIAYDEVTQKELFEGKSDRRVVKSCIKELYKYNIIVTYYGTGFDFPFIRTRALFWQGIVEEELRETFSRLTTNQLKDELKSLGLTVSGNKNDLITRLVYENDEYLAFDFPAYGEIYHFDLYYVIRHKFKLNRNSLAVATHFFGIDGKTPVTGEAWAKAKYADPEAMKYVREHNIEDVVILEKLHDKINPFKKWTRRSI